eukprot:m.84117 g.84117  ORF g.84117 m.84117 type:complete len:360 (+) comp36385_c0_seq4:53-1132(+)
MLTTHSAVLLVFLACCLNVVFLELLIKEAKGSGGIITFFQFLFVAAEGFVFTSKFGQKRPDIPVKAYLLLVMVFFTVSLVNNYVLNFNVPMPLHMVIKSGSLVANMALGVLIMKRGYSASKYLSVTIVSIGIFLCTYMSALGMKKSRTEFEDNETSILFLSIGVTLLILSLIMSAGLGIFQETLYSKYGKVPREVMFYSHALALPGFVLIASDISEHANIFSQSEPLQFGPLSLPKMWFYIAGNVLTQYVCVRSVFFLTSECQSLTVTLVVTLRKFLSLIISIWYFQNPFTVYHWIGAAMVFTGTFIFTDVVGKVKDIFKKEKETETEKEKEETVISSHHPLARQTLNHLRSRKQNHQL